MFHHVVFKVTHACNLACRYCYATREKVGIASRTTLRAAIRSAVQLDADTINFIWHGGEPLLGGVDFFAEAVSIQADVAAWSGKRFLNSLQTNGTLVTPAFAEFFRRHEFAVGISLDGPPPRHDLERLTPGGAGSYERALKGYQTLKEAGLKPGIVCVIDPVSPPQSDLFLDWLSDIGAESISLNPLFAKRSKRYGDYPVFLTSLKDALDRRESRVRVRELVLAGTTVEDRERMGLLDSCRPGWPCYESISSVDEQGYIYFGCDRFMDTGLPGTEAVYRLGHVENGGFRKALTSKRFSRLSALVDKQAQACASVCDLFSTCDGGCLADWIFSQEECDSERPNGIFCQAVRAITKSRL